MMLLIRTLRPNGTNLYLPPKLALRLGARPGSTLTEAQWNDRDLQALLASRVACNEKSGHCDAAWHKKEGWE